MSDPQIRVFSTSPQSSNYSPGSFSGVIAQVARWSEQYGCTGSLVYTDNSLVDSWLTSQIMLQQTTKLRPLVAVQPVYMHPYTVAKMVSSLAFLHGRSICLNMVAGGFRNDLASLSDATPHERMPPPSTTMVTFILSVISSSRPPYQRTCNPTSLFQARPRRDWRPPEQWARQPSCIHVLQASMNKHHQNVTYHTAFAWASLLGLTTMKRGRLRDNAFPRIDAGNLRSS